jgi:type VI secretion system protein ImpF
MDFRQRTPGFTPTLLDKLFDDAPQRVDDALFSKRLDLEELKDSLAADLESLLNSRRSSDREELEGFPLASDSILTFGIRDFVGYSLANPADCSKICETIKKAVERHEPRLVDVKVALVDDAFSTNSLNFSISATLLVYSNAERVSFDAMLKPTLQQYAVSRSRRLGVSYG